MCDDYLDNNDSQVTLMILKLPVGSLVSLVVQLYKTSENNIYEGQMWSTTSVDEELCVMITWTIMMLKLYVGCLALQAVQLYNALENNSIKRHV